MKKILVVEDHADMRDLLLQYIGLMGLTVVAAKHGREGIEKAIEEKPDLILMDLMLPGIDGCEATRILRANPETRNIPILAATALSRDADLKACLEAGCNDCLIKPFTFKQLQQKVRDFLPCER